MTSYSQITILSKTGDTLIGFTKPRAKFLLKQAYRVLQLDTTLKVYQAINVNLEKDLKGTNSMIIIQQEQLKNRNEFIDLKNYEIGSLKAEVKKTQKEVRRQTVFKWLAIGIGGVVTTGLGIAYVKKK